MKVKQRTVCQACRSRKIGCDGRTPACTQCLLRGLFCPGYQADWTFVPQLTKEPPKPRNTAQRVVHPKPALHKRGKKEKKEAEPTVAVVQELPLTPSPSPDDPKRWTGDNVAICPSPSMPLIHVIALVVRCYVPDPDLRFLCPGLAPSQPRICGGWVEALPELIGNGGDDMALSAAIKCLGVAIMSGGPIRKAPISAGLEAYSSALRCLGEGLQQAKSSVPDALAASVMCLLLAELMLPTSLGSWAAHVQGFGTLMQLSRPEVYVSGAAHRLFYGARPTLIILAFLSRKASFLALDPWKTIPFSHEKPSPVQALLNDAVLIPSIFEKIDSLPRSSAKETLSVAQECVAAFENLLTCFDQWEDRFRSETQFPAFWTKQAGEDGMPCIWFQSISVANALTHYWAVQIICRDNIAQLKAKFPELQLTREASPGKESAEDVVELATKICQSIEYLIQDDMRLFGPTSVILPLRAAYDTFTAGGSETREQLLWCQRIIARILGKGFQFVTLFFDLFKIPM